MTTDTDICADCKKAHPKNHIPLQSMLDFSIMWEKRTFPHLRLGQAFCNHFNLHNPTLFYMVDRDDTYDYIQTHYLAK